MFFKELLQIMSPGTDISLAIHRHNETLTVSVLPSLKKLKDEAQHQMQPILLTGSAEELDAEFFSAVSQPVQKANGLLTNMKGFEDSLARVEADKKEALERKKTADKQAQERKTKYDKLVSQAETQEKEGKNDEALKILSEARTLATEPDILKTDTRISQVKSKCLQGSLF